MVNPEGRLTSSTSCQRREVATLYFLALFFLSGFTALVYQIAWQRVLTQVIGIDSYSVALIVTLFMAGLGFGGIVGAGMVATGPDPGLLG